jgi:hypothetical protein
VADRGKLRDFRSVRDREELQNAAHVRLFAVKAVKLNLQRLRGLVVPLFDIAAEKYLPADARRWSAPLADVRRRLTPLHGWRLLSRDETSANEKCAKIPTRYHVTAKRPPGDRMAVGSVLPAEPSGAGAKV